VGLLKLIGIIAKSFAEKVFLFHVNAVGHFERLTIVVPSGVAPVRVVPSGFSSYRSAYNSYFAVLRGAKQVIDMRNWLRGPLIVGRKTCPKLPLLKQSKSVSGA
jgi:hypothetical protein